jgi:hypothetical protein
VSFPLHRLARLHPTAATSSVVAAIVIALVGPAPLARADVHPLPLPFKADVPRDHQWRDHTRLALEVARSLPGHDAEAARRAAVHNLVDETPRVYRPYIDIGPVHRNRFTVTVVGDQACAIWPRRRAHKAEPGPCNNADRRPFPRATAQTATFLGLVYDRSLREARTPRLRAGFLTEFFSRQTIASLAWLYAPHGVGIAGVIDKNRDGLDDDARITLHGRGEAVCLRYAIHKGGHASHRPGICKNLAPRHPHYPPGAGH